MSNAPLVCQVCKKSKSPHSAMIAPSDLNLIYATDSVDEAIEHIRSNAIEPFGLRRVARARRRRAFAWLGERGLSGL